MLCEQIPGWEQRQSLCLANGQISRSLAWEFGKWGKVALGVTHLLGVVQCVCDCDLAPILVWCKRAGSVPQRTLGCSRSTWSYAWDCEGQFKRLFLILQQEGPGTVEIS